MHEVVSRWWAGREVVLSGHALAETYSVLTRLPGDLRLAPADAARLLGARFGPALVMPPDMAARLPDVLAHLGIAGGAVYDAMAALAARAHGCPLATRDARAKPTDDIVGVPVEIVG